MDQGHFPFPLLVRLCLEPETQKVLKKENKEENKK